MTIPLEEWSRNKEGKWEKVKVKDGVKDKDKVGGAGVVIEYKTSQSLVYDSSTCGGSKSVFGEVKSREMRIVREIPRPKSRDFDFFQDPNHRDFFL